ncbi:MAG: four helix bundle protein [bacterium]|nr:four helix bundle protein [bacterium]
MEEKIKNFTDLESWKLAHQLTLEIYKQTQKFPKEETFGVTSQIRRAASSISANIAEGFARFHFNDKKRFYYQARGSVAEVQNFIFLVKDLGLISEATTYILFDQTNQVARLINGLIRSIEQQK